MNFINLYQSIIKTNKSYVCVGLDSELKKIPECLKNETNPIWSFNKEIIDATANYTACYKPNFAFYLSAGKKGLEALEKTIDYIPVHIPVILDCKVGDIGNTMEQYADAFFDEMKVSAITVNPLMGKDVYNAVFKKTDRYIFILALTSNPSAQDYIMKNDLYKTLALDIADIGENKAGAVVGATRTIDIKAMRDLMPQSIFLIPGIGAQGGSLDDVCQFARMNNDDAGFLINSSRGIIFADSSSSFADTAQKETEKLRDQINQKLL